MSDERRGCEILLALGHIPVVARPHPLGGEIIRADVPCGLTVAQIVGEHARNCRVEIAGVVIPEEWWPRIRPKAGTLVCVTRFPEGGGGGGWKMVFRLVAFAALAVLTYGIATPGLIQGLLPEFIQGLTAGAAAAVAAGVGIGGMLLINALCPPAPTGVGNNTSPTTLKSLTGVQNQADPYGAITCVFGTMLVYPKLAANPFTELLGDDQYLRCLFDFGYGVTNYAQMQIGSNDLANYTDVDYEVGQNPSLFSQDIAEVAAGDELDTDGDVATRTSDANADEVSIDLVFGTGLFALNSSGNTETATCKLLIQYQQTGQAGVAQGGPVTNIPIITGGCYREAVSATIAITGDGQGAAAYPVISKIGGSGSTVFYGVTAIRITSQGQGYTYANATLRVNGAMDSDQAAVIGTPQITVSGGAWLNALQAKGLMITNGSAQSDGTNLVVSSSAQQSLRIGIRWKLPANGQYNVIVSRVSSNYQGTDDQHHEGNLTWTVIRTIRYTAASTTPTTKLAMRIKATDQLNGTLNQFNLLLSQVIPVWNGQNWINQQTSNPAWIFRWLLRDCPGNPRRVDEGRIDDDTLKEWGAECDANGFTFNYTNDQPTTVFELLKIVCACGRASFTVVDGKYSVVRDLAQATPVQIFTPRNTASFEGTRAFVDVVHALRVQFINAEASYQQDEVVVYDDGFDATNAVNFEQLQIPGCTDAEMAWKLGRYHLACARLRPNSYSWTTDIEHLVCNRGDLVLFASDVVAVGLGWGRLKSITMDGNGNVSAITVDEPQNVTDATKTYAMRFRRQDGTVAVVVVTFEPDEMVAAFTLAVPTLGINPGDLFLFGIQGQDSLSLVVTKIEPTTELAAKLTAVDAAPAVLTADQGYADSKGVYHAGVPQIASSITGQAWLDAPLAPQMVICASSQSLAAQDDSGTTSPIMLVTVA